MQLHTCCKPQQSDVMHQCMQTTHGWVCFSHTHVQLLAVLYCSAVAKLMQYVRRVSVSLTCTNVVCRYQEG